MFTGLVGLIVFILDIGAILSILRSAASGGAKFLWCFLVILLPVLGLIIWYAAGPKSRSV
jgi:succinate dehydrogenase/fumarate reductase cytochrome b subunit